MTCGSATAAGTFQHWRRAPWTCSACAARGAHTSLHPAPLTRSACGRSVRSSCAADPRARASATPTPRSSHSLHHTPAGAPGARPSATQPQSAPCSCVGPEALLCRCTLIKTISRSSRNKNSSSNCGVSGACARRGLLCECAECLRAHLVVARSSLHMHCSFCAVHRAPLASRACALQHSPQHPVPPLRPNCSHAALPCSHCSALARMSLTVSSNLPLCPMKLNRNNKSSNSNSHPNSVAGNESNFASSNSSNKGTKAKKKQQKQRSPRGSACARVQRRDECRAQRSVRSQHGGRRSQRGHGTCGVQEHGVGVCVVRA